MVGVKVVSTLTLHSILQTMAHLHYLGLKNMGAVREEQKLNDDAMEYYAQAVGKLLAFLLTFTRTGYHLVIFIMIVQHMMDDDDDDDSRH